LKVETSKITGDFHLCKTRQELVNDTYLSMGIVQKKPRLKVEVETWNSSRNKKSNRKTEISFFLSSLPLCNRKRESRWP